MRPGVLVEAEHGCVTKVHGVDHYYVLDWDALGTRNTKAVLEFAATLLEVGQFERPVADILYFLVAQLSDSQHPSDWPMTIGPTDTDDLPSAVRSTRTFIRESGVVRTKGLAAMRLRGIADYLLDGS